MSVLRKVAAWRTPRFFGAFLMVVSILLGGAYYKQVHCQASYNRAFAKSLDARSAAANARTDALDDVVGGVGEIILNPPMTPAEKAEAAVKYPHLFQAFAVAKIRNDKARDDNPYPEIPNC